MTDRDAEEKFYYDCVFDMQVDAFADAVIKNEACYIYGIVRKPDESDAALRDRLKQAIQTETYNGS